MRFADEKKDFNEIIRFPLILPCEIEKSLRAEEVERCHDLEVIARSEPVHSVAPGPHMGNEHAHHHRRQQPVDGPPPTGEERNEGRRDHRSGHYDRKLQTKAGSVTLKVPKLRSMPSRYLPTARQ